MSNRDANKIALAVVLAAILHVGVFATMMGYYHTKTDCQACVDDCGLVAPPPVRGPRIGDIGMQDVALPKINVAARDEIKQASPAECCGCDACVGPGCGCCPECGSEDVKQQILRRPNVVICPTCPQVQPTYRPVPTTTPRPTPVPQVQPIQPVLPQSQPSVVPSQPATTTNKALFQLALFLDSSAKSAGLNDWFNRDPDLVALRGKVDFQIYTPDNPLYKTRYADVIPTNQFPAVLFLKPDGGHLHAAGGRMIPLTAAELYADLKHGYNLAKSVEMAEAVPQDSGAIREKGYSWDDQVAPTMQLTEQNCPGGICPPREVPSWRPGDKVRDLFGPGPSGMEAILWASPIEIAVFVVLGIIVMLAFAMILKKR
jgi:hypothetical protein